MKKLHKKQQRTDLNDKIFVREQLIILKEKTLNIHSFTARVLSWGVCVVGSVMGKVLKMTIRHINSNS